MRCSLEEVIREAEVIVITNGSPSFQHVAERLRQGQILIDLVGVAKEHSNTGGCYEGICW
jgi:hypothetical protein